MLGFIVFGERGVNVVVFVSDVVVILGMIGNGENVLVLGCKVGYLFEDFFFVFFGYGYIGCFDVGV